MCGDGKRAASSFDLWPLSYLTFHFIESAASFSSIVG
jgi:hypothetical protein